MEILSCEIFAKHGSIFAIIVFRENHETSFVETLDWGLLTDLRLDDSARCLNETTAKFGINIVKRNV